MEAVPCQEQNYTCLPPSTLTGFSLGFAFLRNPKCLYVILWEGQVAPSPPHLQLPSRWRERWEDALCSGRQPAFVQTGHGCPAGGSLGACHWPRVATTSAARCGHEAGGAGVNTRVAAAGPRRELHPAHHTVLPSPALPSRLGAAHQSCPPRKDSG